MGEQTIQNDLSWLQRHERLLIVFLVLIAGAWGWNKYVNYASVRDHEAAAVSKQALLDAQKQAKDADAKYQQMQDYYNSKLDAVIKANQMLQAQVSQLNINLAKQKQADQSMPLPDLAKRWEFLAGINDDEMAATGNAVTVNDSGARKTVEKLEEVPVLEQKDAANQQIITNLNDLNTTCQKTLDTAKAEVVALKSENAAQVKADKDELAKVKADARKSKIKWLAGGIVSGVIAGLKLATVVGL